MVAASVNTHVAIDADASAAAPRKACTQASAASFVHRVYTLRRSY
jgi:hypothetical protein